MYKKYSPDISVLQNPHVARSKAKKFFKNNKTKIKDYKKINFNDVYETESHEFFFKKGVLLENKEGNQIVLAIKFTINQYNEFYTCIKENEIVIIQKKYVNEKMFKKINNV